MHALQRPFRALALALALALVTGAGLATSVHAASPDGAAKFIRDMGHKAITDLSDESTPMADRVTRFRELVDKGFAMKPISRFVLGRYARVASESQMTEFREIFLEVVARRFLPLFEGYTTADFRVEGAKSDPQSDNLYRVNTRVRSPKNDQFVKAAWRVRYQDDHYEIVDVMAEGVSMAITLRSEYSSVIQQNGGRVEALISRLEKRLETGNFESTAMNDREG